MEISGYILIGVGIFCFIALIFIVISIPSATKHDMDLIYKKAYEIKYSDSTEEEKIKDFQDLTGATIEESKNFLMRNE